MQRRLVYEVSGEPNSAALILCDHPSGITIGREGSRAHIRLSPEELMAHRWRVRWVGRGGGAVLHLPGQVACYPIIPLHSIGRTVVGFLNDLQNVVIELLQDYELSGTIDVLRPGVRMNGRTIAQFGIAVHEQITAFGLVLNIDPDVESFRLVQCGGDFLPMTSLQREAAGRVRIASVRQRLVELIATRFAFDRVSVFHALPGAPLQVIPHAAAQRA